MPNDSSQIEIDNFQRDKLLVRKCPNCGSLKGATCFEMYKNDFVDQNPTHNLDWFDQMQIPEDFCFPFIECSKCHFIYGKFRLNDHYNFEFYNIGILSGESQKKIVSKKKRILNIRIWLELISLSSNDGEIKLLDFGGGWGDFLYSANNIGINVFGLEFDQRKINFAQKNGIQMGGYELIDEQAPFDIFMCNQVLEHLNDPKEALHKVRHLCRENAVGFIGVPNFNRQKIGSIKEKIKNGTDIPKEVNPFGHLNYFSPKSIERMIKSCGFKILKPLDSKLGRKWLLNKPHSTMLFVKAI